MCLYVYVYDSAGKSKMCSIIIMKDCGMQWRTKLLLLTATRSTILELIIIMACIVL